MEFKQLEIKPESSWIKRTFSSKHLKKSFIYTIIGAAVGFLYFYLSEGKNMDVLQSGDIIQSMLVGGFFGFFITNSPCARNKC
jgi:hypothetical protein